MPTGHDIITSINHNCDINLVVFDRASINTALHSIGHYSTRILFQLIHFMINYNNKIVYDSNDLLTSNLIPAHFKTVKNICVTQDGLYLGKTIQTLKQMCLNLFESVNAGSIYFLGTCLLHIIVGIRIFSVTPFGRISDVYSCQFEYN